MNRRTLLVTAGWAGAAVLAVLVGIAAIGVIGADLTDAGSRPRTEAQVARELASVPSPVPSASPSRPSPRPSASQAAGDAPVAVSRTLATRGGTVVARCAGGRPQIVTMSPAPGFSLHEQGSTEGEFRSTSDNHDRVKFTIVCSGGRPALVPHAGDDD
ncbi:hypothetical protein AB0368_23465 [Actinoplanes sp. NPDC051475]|uniref:hypothetical protein n=1 Tax=Actinoplanes sp. NPDC051475 TaxID=3157225 RepID=UPI0034500B09